MNERIEHLTHCPVLLRSCECSSIRLYSVYVLKTGQCNPLLLLWSTLWCHLLGCMSRWVFLLIISSHHFFPVHLVLLPEPSYSGPENIIFIPGKDLEEELSADKRLVWLVEMYAAWNPACADFAPQFSELSAKYVQNFSLSLLVILFWLLLFWLRYSLDNLKFAKVDLARSPETAEKYQINVSSFSKQLPTLILFKGGKEEIRRPLVASSGKLIQFSFTFVSNWKMCNFSLDFTDYSFSQENVVNTFDLNNLYQECKKNPVPNKDKKVKKQEWIHFCTRISLADDLRSFSTQFLVVL